MSRGRRIVVTGGYTAGHVYPAMAVLDAYRRRVKDLDVLFLGSSHGLESDIVLQHKIRFAGIEAAPLYGVGPVGTVRALQRTLVGTAQARRLLRQHRAELVIGFGGYVSAAPLFAAVTLGVKRVVFEANVVPGRTNRLVGRVVQRVFLASEVARASFAGGVSRVVGYPSRADIVTAGQFRRPPPASSGRPLRFLITGGSLGSRFLNDRLPAMCSLLAARGMSIEIWHQAGHRDVSAVRQAYQGNGLSARVDGFIDDMAGAYMWADFAITRAGAGTLAELAATGLPAFLVPHDDVADDHQAANATVFSLTGGAWWCREGDWCTKGIAGRIYDMLGDQTAWQAASQGARIMASPNAADDIVTDCEILLARDR